MLVEGIYLYLFVVKVYNITNKIRRYHGFSWGKYNYFLCFQQESYPDNFSSELVFFFSGFPAIIVAMSLGIAAGKDGIESFVSDK